MLLLFSTINIQKIFIRHNTDLLQTNERHLILRKYSVCRSSDMSPAPSLDTFVDNFWLLKQSCYQRTCPCSVTWWICHFLSHWCVSRWVFFYNFTAFFDWQRKKHDRLLTKIYQIRPLLLRIYECIDCNARLAFWLMTTPSFLSLSRMLGDADLADDCQAHPDLCLYLLCLDLLSSRLNVNGRRDTSIERFLRSDLNYNFYRLVRKTDRAVP